MPIDVFVDGQTGTTALQIFDRLAGRADVRLVRLAPDDRKRPEIRRQAINDADVAILCLPDAAAREAIGFIASDRPRVIDASTAHRTDPGWVYGLPELKPDQPEIILQARFVANPGCYASAAILMLAPLVRSGLLPDTYPVSLFGISGYTGGGKAMVAEFDDPATAPASFVYALNLAHKHIPEIRKHAALAADPIFVPSVGHFPQGMIVSMPLHASLLARPTGADEIHDLLQQTYASCPRVLVADKADTPPLRLAADRLAGTDDIELHVYADPDRIVLTAVLDNLGKGAAGVAVQNLDIMFGLPAAI